MNLDNLAPAPWKADGQRVEGPDEGGDRGRMVIYDEGGHTETEAEFIALARNAFDVMVRRGWGVACYGPGRWVVPGFSKHWYVVHAGPPYDYPDPFTALVEADNWLKAREEK